MNDIIWHKHHIIPRHIGGTDNPSNIIKVNIPMHAMLHKILWEEHQNPYDFISWRALDGQITFAEATKLAQKNYMTNRVVSEETRKKISEAGKGRIVSEETRAKLRASRQGRIFSPETRKKISESNKGKRLGVKVIFSEEHRKNLSNSKKGHKAGMTNKKHSPETIEKMSKSQTLCWEKKHAI